MVDQLYDAPVANAPAKQATPFASQGLMIYAGGILRYPNHFSEDALRCRLVDFLEIAPSIRCDAELIRVWFRHRGPGRGSHLLRVRRLVSREETSGVALRPPGERPTRHRDRKMYSDR